MSKTEKMWQLITSKMRPRMMKLRSSSERMERMMKTPNS